MPGGKTAWNGKDEQGRATYEKIINRAKAAALAEDTVGGAGP